MPHSPAQILPLDNDLTLIHQCLPTPVVVVDVWIRAGAAIEPTEWAGMAHFLEHMIFKGTARIQPGEFDQVVENQGGVTNAATSHDYAHFYITTTIEHLPSALPYLAELLLQAAIPEVEFERERQVVLEEIRQADDNPDWWGFQRFVETIYPDHPYGRSVLGTAETLMMQSAEAMRCFHHSRYQPENMIVVVVGGIEQWACRDLVQRSFQEFSQPESYPEPTWNSGWLQSLSYQEFTLPYLEQARLMMGWVGPGVEDLQQACGLDLLTAVLAEGRSSQLVQELREERQMVQDIGGDFSLQKDSSLFTLTAWLEPEYVQAVEDLILNRLQALQTHLLSPQALQRAKRLLINDFIFGTETPGQLAGLYGYYGTIARPELALTYPHQIAALSAEDLMELAQKYLSTDYYAVTVLKPDST
jgi:predicted Zn-dependent peptidase